MRVTWDLLCANPDVYSIWNMRKEFIVNKKADYERRLDELRSSEELEVAEVMMQPQSEKQETKPEGSAEDNAEPSCGDNQSKEEAKPPTADELTSEFQKLCNEELELTEFALLKNSKSYSAWNHRLWILSLIPKPDFQREFRLNELYLQKDGRNRMFFVVRTFSYVA